MPLPAAVGFVLNAISNQIVGFPVVVSRLAVFTWGIKYSEQLAPGTMENIDANSETAARLREKIVDDFMRDQGYQFPNVGIDPTCNRNWNAAKTPPRRDPLAIDLDGDGIETIGSTLNGIPSLFDHDGDGVKTGTGWLKPDDAWLVRDLDGSGAIERGQELFGVDTYIRVDEAGAQPTIRRARSGFDALRALDANGDGTFDSADSAWNEVLLWQDLNGDAVSQAGELFSLQSKGIIGISVREAEGNIDLGNGNSVTASAAVHLATGGDIVASGVGLTSSNLNLVDNPFYREFVDSVPLTASAQASPEMRGSGWVRDLREAMSGDAVKGGALQEQVDLFSSAKTRTEQLNIVDGLIERWAATAPKYAYGGQRALDRLVIAETDSSFIYRYVGVKRPEGWSVGDYATLGFESSEKYEMTIVLNGQPTKTLTNAGKNVVRQLGIVETFNGSPFIQFTVTRPKHNGTGGASGSGSGGGSGAVADPMAGHWITEILLADQQIQSIQQAYDVLRESVYLSLASQTRLRPYLDSIGLVINDTDIRFDVTPMHAMLETAYASSPQHAFEDLIDLTRASGTTLDAVGFDTLSVLRTWIDAVPTESPLRDLLAELGQR